jgi:hypothetical protein
MRRFLVLLVLLTTACGSTVPIGDRPAAVGASQSPGLSGPGASDGSTLGGGSGTTTEAIALARTSGGSGGTTGDVAAGVLPRSGGETGVTLAPSANREPIQIGFITTSMSNAGSLGFNAGQSYADKATFEALVAEYNAHGGVAGHRIEPVYGETDTANSDWSTQFAAVCAKFTQDNHVKVVIGYTFMFLPSFEACLAKAGVPHLYGGYQPGDVLDQQQLPTLIGTGHPTVDGNQLTALEGARRSGLLTASTKLGVMLDTCAHGDRAYTRTSEPWLKRHHVTYETAILECTDGAGDISSMAAAVSSAQLRFAANGVNLVFAPGLELLIFMADAQSQGYEPEYLGATGGSVIGANAPASQMRHFHGFGWVPSVDVDTRHQPYAPTPPQRACIAKLGKHGLQPSQFNDFMTAYEACDGIELYAKALAAQGSTEAAAIVRGVVAALPSYVGAGTYGGAMQATSHQRGGGARYREYGWTESCSCLTYRGGVFSVPNP